MPAVAGRTGGGKREVEMWASEKWTMWGSEMCDVGEMWALWGSTRIPHTTVDQTTQATKAPFYSSHSTPSQHSFTPSAHWTLILSAHNTHSIQNIVSAHSPLRT